MPTLSPARPRSNERRAAPGFPDVASHVPRMLAVARSILASDDLAFDAVQETLLRLWHEESEPRDLRGWLVRAVAHRSLDSARSIERRRRHERLAADERPRGSTADPSDDLDARMLAELVERALDALRPEFAAAFRAHVFDGLDPVAIAARLGIPIGTVRTRIHRARRALRSSLARLVHAERRCSICHERE